MDALKGSAQEERRRAWIEGQETAAPKKKARPKPAAPPPLWLVAGLLFGSGLSALVYQTAWQRELHLVFGASSAATSAVLGLFLGGLGFGGLYFGKRVARHRRPLVFYAKLELGVSVGAAVSPLLVDLLSRAYVISGGSAVLGLGGATVLRLLIATLVMGGPVLLMGGTLPALARAVEVDADEARSRVALLYGINTAGAVFGALLGTFFLFEHFGTRWALWMAAAANVGVALTAFALGRRGPTVVPDRSVDEPTSPSSRALESGTESRRVQTAFAYWTAWIAGFGFLLLELVWYRMLAPILGGTTFTFGLILAVALAGIGLGGVLYSRRREDQPASLTLLGTTTALEALCVLLPFALGDSIAVYAAMTRQLGAWSFSALVASWTSVAMLVVFPAALVSGYQFPLLFALLGRGKAHVAEHVSRVVAVNTLGAIVGALVGGFVLIPHFGALACWKFVAVAFALTALGTVGAALASHLRHLRSAIWTVLVVSVVLIFTGASGPSGAWRHSPIGAGRAEIQRFDRNELEAWRRQQNDQIVWERDGIEAAVAMANTDGISFLVNGKADGSVMADRGTQAMLGVLPALLHPFPRSAFVIGLGTGMTAGWIGKIEGMVRVDVAELEPVVADVARRAHGANHDVMNQPNVTVHYGDGRELLQTSATSYDLIVSEPSNPYRIGISTLFTREFYHVVSTRLAQRGLFAQWVQGYEIDSQSFRSIVRTLHTEFEHVEAWHPQGSDIVLIASHEKRSYDANDLRQRIALEPYRSAVNRMWLGGDAEDVLSHFIGSAAFVQRLVEFGDQRINTDDKNQLEYDFARGVGTRNRSIVLSLLEQARAADQHRPDVRGTVDWARVDEVEHRAWLIHGGGYTPAPLPPDGTARTAAVTAACTSQLKKVAKLWRSQSRAEPIDDLELYTLALGYAFQGIADAYPLLGQLAERGYRAEAELGFGHLGSRAGHRARAMDHYLLSLDALRGGQLPLCHTGEDLLVSLQKVAIKEPSLALQALHALGKGPLTAELADARRLDVMEQLGFSVMGVEGIDPRVCLVAMGQHAEFPRWSETFLAQRLECFQHTDHPWREVAAAELAEFRAASGGELLPALPRPAAAPAPAAPAPPVATSALPAPPASAAPEP